MSSTTNPDPPSTAPSFVPLEANPETMTALARRLGLSPALALHDVYSLSDPDLLAFVPRPTLALLLVFPVSAAYESQRLAEDAASPEYEGKGEGEPVLWFRQTIRNACGLMGLLHAVGNGPAREFIEPNTTLSRLLAEAEPLSPPERSALLERTPELAAAHASAAASGDTGAPDARDDVDLHYVTFVKGRDGTLWELDGRRKGPIARGQLDPADPSQDALCDKALLWGPLKFLEREAADLRFSCVALAGALE